MVKNARILPKVTLIPGDRQCDVYEEMMGKSSEI